MMLFIVWIVLIHLEQKNNLESSKNVFENKKISDVVMPSEDTKILEFNQHRTSDNRAFIIYADLGSLIKGINGCKNSFEKLSTITVAEHILCGYPGSTNEYFMVHIINIMYIEKKIAWKSSVNPEVTKQWW